MILKYRDMNTAFDKLLGELAEIYLREGRSGGVAASEVLKLSRIQELRLPTEEPSAIADDLMRKVCAHPLALPISLSIMACRKLFRWNNWGNDVLPREISRRLFTVELVGPDGVCHHDEVRVGLQMSEGYTDYPVSSHSGEETHFVISGTAEWTAGGDPYSIKTPGEFVHHPAWTPHGRRTLDEPY